MTSKPGPHKEPAKEATVTAPVVANKEPAPKAAEPTAVAATSDGTPLLAEVQSFIQKREELARKLSDEIAATEAKLAELKRTSEALFPENKAAAPVAKDKKAKKLPKAKPISNKAAVAAPAGEIAAVDANEAADAPIVD